MGFQKKLSAGEFCVLAEINTPKGIDITTLLETSACLKSRIDAVILPDMDNGLMHMSSIGSGTIMLQNGLEPLVHICGRDRNRVAIQGDLLSAHVMGLRNLLVVQAEDIAYSDQQNAKAVDDLDEQDLVQMISSLNKGVDMSGFELDGTPEFFAGCSIPSICNDAHLEKEMESAKRKIEAGAKFIMTQPVFDIDYYTHILNSLSSLNVPVISSVFLLKSVGMARYISINDPNSRVGEQTISRIRKAKNREAECIQIAGEMISKLKKVSQGIKISALGWEDRLPSILESAGL
jgi:methylenetetrahydrofolate reductase (NADPH)